MKGRILLAVVLAGLALAGCDRAADAPPVAEPVAAAAPVMPAAPPPRCQPNAAREIDRNSPGLKCLERKSAAGTTFDFKVPPQHDRNAFDTDCPVPLRQITHGGKCIKQSVLAGKSIEVTYDATADKFFFTLKHGAAIELDKVEATPHGSAPTVDYRSYVDAGKQLEYFIYLVDTETTSTKLMKFYMVDAFDLRDTTQECRQERPETALRADRPCKEPSFTAQQLTPLDAIFDTFQIDTGGGYEPPP